MTRWLVRTSSNEIHGPFEQEQLIQTIQAGRWEPRDEVCRENHYWFFFNESEELRAQLGISWPDLSESSSDREEETDEITDVQTKTMRLEPDASSGRGARTSLSDKEAIVFADPERPVYAGQPPGFWLILLALAAVAAVFFFL